MDNKGERLKKRYGKQNLRRDKREEANTSKKGKVTQKESRLREASISMFQIAKGIRYEWPNTRRRNIDTAGSGAQRRPGSTQGQVKVE